MEEELKCCPSCNFSQEKYNEHLKKAQFYAGTIESYMPMIYRDRHLEKWIIECRNCGMEVIFSMKEKSENVDLWNKLPRAK